MKKLFPIIECFCMLWLVVGCQQEDINGESDSVSEEILFAIPEVQVSEVEFSRGITSATLAKTSLEAGERFAVWGYCLPYTPGTTSFAYNAGSSPWLTKRNLCSPHVFDNNLNIVTVGGGQTIIRKWFQPGKNLQGNDDTNIGADAENFQYTFFAYYPADDDGFKINPDANGNSQAYVANSNSLIVTYTMPYEGTASSPSAVNLSDVTYKTNDAMLAMVENHKKSNGKVAFTFSHLLTSLNFQINNYTQYEDEAGTEHGKDLKITSIKLGGTFHKKLVADLFKDSSENYSFSDTYTAIYTIFSGEHTVPYVASTEKGEITQVIGNPLLLLCGMQVEEDEVPKDKYLGPNPYAEYDSGKTFEDNAKNSGGIYLEVTYQYKDPTGDTTYDGEVTTKHFPLMTQDRTFTTHVGVNYIIQLNWIGESFVIIIVPISNSQWEDGENADDNTTNDDVVFE